MTRAVNLVRKLPVHRHARIGLSQCRSLSAATQDTGARKSGAAVGVAAVSAALAIVAGTYYVYPRDQSTTRPPVHTNTPPKPAAVHGELGRPSAPPPVSVRDELAQKLRDLKAELEDLRKQKRDNLIDLKKKEIKEEIRIIQSGLAQLDKR